MWQSLHQLQTSLWSPRSWEFAFNNAGHLLHVFEIGVSVHFTEISTFIGQFIPEVVRNILLLSVFRLFYFILFSLCIYVYILLQTKYIKYH